MSDLHRPSHVQSLLIWGGWYGSRNIGDDAILIGLKRLIERVNPGRDLYIRALTTDPDHTSTFGVTGERALVKPELLRPWAWFRVLSTFARADLVVVSGGTPVFDSSHAIRTLYFALPLLFGKPFIVFGAGVKPLRSRYGRRSVRYFLRRARHISVRDEDSMAILSEVGIDGAELTADSAFFAEPAAEDALRGLLGQYGIGENESLLVVAPRLLSSERKRLYLQERMGESLIRDTPGKLAQAIDSLASRFDKIVLVAMHFHGPDSDVPIMRDVLARTAASNVVLVDRELRPDAVIALFRRARLVIGIRLHALLLSASMGTPIVAIAYEQKVRGLLSRLKLDEYCLDLFDLDAERMTATALRAMAEEPALRKHIAERVETLRQVVLACAERVLRLDAEAPPGWRNARER